MYIENLYYNGKPQKILRNPIEISTASEMNAILTRDNVGIIYRFIGPTDDTYTQGDLYEVSRNKDVFSYNSWEDIIKACQDNKVPDTWKVGDQKIMTINDVDYTIDIIGKNHDTYTSGGIAPLTFQLHDCYDTKYAISLGFTNYGGYDNTYMYKSYLPSIKRLMPTKIQESIKFVDKKSSTGNQSTSIETISCDLFLLSEIEVFGELKYSVSGEGSQYEYYREGGSKLKFLTGSSIQWWERSPVYNHNQTFCYVYDGSSSTTFADTAYKYGVSFAFCF